MQVPSLPGGYCRVCGDEFAGICDAGGDPSLPPGGRTFEVAQTVPHPPHDRLRDRHRLPASLQVRPASSLLTVKFVWPIVPSLRNGSTGRS